MYIDLHNYLPLYLGYLASHTMTLLDDVVFVGGDTVIGEQGVEDASLCIANVCD